MTLEEEVLNEEFLCYLRVAKSLMKTLMRPKDKQICKKLLSTCEKHNSSCNTELRMYNNCFLKFFLKILNWTSANQPRAIYSQWYPDKPACECLKIWLEDKKSYLSIKDMPNGSVVFYCAVAKNPSAGWEEGGLTKLQNASPKNQKTPRSSQARI